MTTNGRRYCGRFAPSPTGPLHLGSLAAALASWLDARAHGGRWLVRIEDIDPPREEAGAAQAQLAALAALGLQPDEPPTFQSANTHRYLDAAARLQAAGRVYRCACSRTAVEEAARRLGLASNVYPGTCRDRNLTSEATSLRVRVPAQVVSFTDRACGPFWQHLENEVGDFVVQRADGLWAYQLAVVVDDGVQAITDVVRGADLLDNTPRQIYLQQLLGLPTPRYLHVAVARNAAGEKLSKQSGAPALDLSDPLEQLELGWRHLRFAASGATTVAEFLSHAVKAWQERWCRDPGGADTIGAGGKPWRAKPGPDSTRPG
jgi:glutamyl-Q tRNA(Asp) synthetase